MAIVDKLNEAIGLLNALPQIEEEIAKARYDVEKNAWKTIFDCRLQDAINVLESIKGPITNTPVIKEEVVTETVRIDSVPENISMNQAEEMVQNIPDSFREPDSGTPTPVDTQVRYV